MEKKVTVLWLGINADYLREAGESIGFSDLGHNNERPDLVVVVDWTSADRRKIKEMRRIGVPAILIAQEPSVVIPKHLPNRLRHLFNYRITVGRPGGDAWINWPQSWRTERNIQSRRLNRGVLINADKYSAIRGELYSLRRSLVAVDERIDLFGPGWSDAFLTRFRRWISALVFATLNGGKVSLSSAVGLTKAPLHYLGTSNDKQTTLEKYKYSVVIENSQEYLSEKLFDCFFAGTIPIYVGADLDVLGIPRRLVVEAEPTISSVRAAMDFAARMNLKDYQADLEIWMADPQVEALWSEKLVMEHLLSKIKLWHKDHENSAGSV